jgi:hypothetical protein
MDSASGVKNKLGSPEFWRNDTMVVAEILMEQKNKIEVDGFGLAVEERRIK